MCSRLAAVVLGVFASQQSFAQDIPLYVPNYETNEYSSDLRADLDDVKFGMAEARQSDGHIYLRGGYYDGAAAGQTVEMVVTPDDVVLCTFAMAPLMDVDVATLDAFRFIQVDIYDNLAAILLPNITTLDNYELEKFILQTRRNNRVTETILTHGDPRFETFSRFVFMHRNPCWTFG